MRFGRRVAPPTSRTCAAIFFAAAAALRFFAASSLRSFSAAFAMSFCCCLANFASALASASAARCSSLAAFASAFSTFFFCFLAAGRFACKKEDNTCKKDTVQLAAVEQQRSELLSFAACKRRVSPQQQCCGRSEEAATATLEGSDWRSFQNSHVNELKVLKEVVAVTFLDAVDAL